MISRLKGVVSHIEHGSIVLSVGGVGFKLAIPSGTLQQLKHDAEANLWTHLSVRETSLDLYGFLHKEDLDFFLLLIGVSGIGPKSALGVMSAASTDTLIRAIRSGDTTHLTEVIGIGKRHAEKIVLELKEKVPKTEKGSDEDISNSDHHDLLEALITLGYSQKDARNTLKKIPSEINGTQARIKEALRILGGTR